MLAALMSFRLREAVFAAGLQNTARWWTPDEVGATELPLARAAERALSSMHCVLERTYERYLVEIEGIKGESLEAHLRRTKAAEVRLVSNAHVLRDPPDVEKYRARVLGLEELEGNAMDGDLRDCVVSVVSDGRFAPGPS
jgi:pyridoxine kinase